MPTVPLVAFVVFGGAFVALAVGVVAVRERPDPMAWPLAVLMVAVAAWAIPHGISFGYTDPETVAFWHRLRYPGTVLAPTAYFVLVLKYAGHERWLSPRTYALLGVMPGIALAAVWTNDYHRLFWRSVATERFAGASVFVPEYGPLYQVNVVYLYLLTFAALVVLANLVVRSGPIYRKQASLMFLGGLVPFATNVAVRFGLGPGPTIDFTTTALAVSGVAFALALFHFDLLAIRPVARDLLVERLDDGVVVVGPNGRVRDFNATAGRILSDLAVDRPADAVLPAAVSADGGELVVETDEGRRLFRTRSTPLLDGRGVETGRIVYLNDVTGIVEREQRISVLNRVLRHNIRNQLNVAHGRLDLLESELSGTARDNAAKAERSIERVFELAEKARDLERMLRDSETSAVASPVDVVSRAVAGAREEFPEATVEFDAPGGDGPSVGRVAVVDAEFFETAVGELIENAVLHNDREEPTVAVEIERGGEYVHVRVRDTGPGIPEDERTVLSARSETTLEHGTGLGLWLVKWTASLSGGDLSIEDNDPRGSVVTLSLPVVDE